MAAIVRCDICKGTNDDPKIGQVLREWDVLIEGGSGRHMKVSMTISTNQDMCRECVKKALVEPYLKPITDRER